MFGSFQRDQNYSIFKLFSIMTEVVVEQQLQLVEIIEFAQTKLIKNFTLLSKRLNKIDGTLLQQAETTQLKMDSTHQKIRHLEQLFVDQQAHHAQTVVQLNEKINALEQSQIMSVADLKDLPVGIKRLNDQLFNTQLHFQEKMKIKQRQLEEAIHQISTLTVDQFRLSDQINKKENRVEAEKIIKETEILKDKNSHLQSQLRLANHKIQKIQILNEKAERLQAKKEIEMMKEIEDKVKKELKMNINTRNSSTLGANGTTTPLSMLKVGTNIPGISSQDLINQIHKRTSSILTQEQLYNLNSLGSQTPIKGCEIDHIIQRWSQKIKAFEIQLKEIHQNLNCLNKSNTGQKKPDTIKETSSDGIRDKINEIKPEIVKLWAKLDTMEDRINFGERKTQQKLKGVGELTALIKENNMAKLDEKLKNLQTEIFTNLKELKAKVETKVAQTDYDKYRQAMEDRISQINDLIFLKSDKLQVKKALLFLESKIKEIILVISEDEENQKDALLTKKHIKCISCDKELDKFSGVVSSPKGNWDSLPYKDHPPEILGRFGMTNFGSLAKKIKKLESKDLPLLTKKAVNQSFQNSS